ncbi:CARF protein, partial [Eudromia elegans]|nr:CARF protein [Eudromia elegans]
AAAAMAGEPEGRTAEEVAWAEALRGACEPEHHWRHRREFLLRNVAAPPPLAGSAELQRLVSLSMVWANHVFLGCRYPPQVMGKALDMAEGIRVSGAPVRTTRDELVAKVKKRRVSSSNEGVEEPFKKRAIEESKESKDTGKDVKITMPEASKETESTLPKQQETETSKDSESSNSFCSSNQEAGTASGTETEGKPANAENTTEQNPAPLPSETDSAEKPYLNPSKESKCENVQSPEKKAVPGAVPPAAASAAQPSEVPLAAAGAVQPSAVSPAGTGASQPVTVPLAAKSTLQPSVVPSAAKGAPQPIMVPPAAKSTPQPSTVAVATKGNSQASAVSLSSKTPAIVSSGTPKSSAQVGTALLLTPRSSSQVGASLLLAPKGSSQAGSSLLLAPKSSTKVASSLLTSKSSAEVAASLLAARSGAQQGSSLLASKSSAQVAASLLAARSGTQGTSRGGAQAGTSPLSAKGGAQTASAQLATKSGTPSSAGPARALCKPLTSEDAKERQPFFNRLYKAVAWKLVAVGGFSPNVNHAELLNSSIQSVKATLDVAFVPLKELADLPQNKSSLENIVCELRCKSVYLGTGCGKSMENAKAVASREALKLFLKKKVIVKICKRKYKGSEIEDLVLLDEESKPSNLPPALRNPREII